MDQIEIFYRKIPDYDNKSAGELIPYFSYYCTRENDEEYFQITDINECYEKLYLNKYSNISSYLSSKTKGKNIFFIKNKKGYKLNRHMREQIESELNVVVPIPVTSEFFDIEIIQPVRDNTKPIAVEMCQCYSIGAFTASCVMMRRLLETLIIDCFESHQSEDGIKSKDNNYLFLSDLIPAYLDCKEWTHSKNINNHLKEIKKLGDQSAHNRFFIGRKSDMDNIKSALRQTIEEIVHITDYPAWNERLKNKKNN